MHTYISPSYICIQKKLFFPVYHRECECLQLPLWINNLFSSSFFLFCCCCYSFHKVLFALYLYLPFSIHVLILHRMPPFLIHHQWFNRRHYKSKAKLFAGEKYLCKDLHIFHDMIFFFLLLLLLLTSTNFI